MSDYRGLNFVFVDGAGGGDCVFSGDTGISSVTMMLHFSVCSLPENLYRRL